MRKSFKVKIHEDDPERRHKWYWADDPNVKPLEWWQTGNTSGNTMASKTVTVTDDASPLFKHCYRYSDSLYIDKTDCTII